MTKTRLCYLITRSEPGGAQSHVLALLRGFRDRYDLGLASGEDLFLMDAAREMGIQTHLFPDLTQPFSPRKDLRAFRDIRAYLREYRPALLHIHSSKAGILGRLAARKSGAAVVFTAHGWAFAEGVPLPRRIVALVSERIAGRYADRIVTVSRADLGLALRYRIAPERKLVCIHNGIDDTPWRANAGGGDAVRIIMVARFVRQKDHATLLRAVSRLGSRYRLLLIGDGPGLPAMKELSRELGVAGSVEFAGERSDVDELLAGSDIFVLASRWEGLPISLLEAMRAGLPSVATDVGGVAEVVHPDCGMLVEREDDEQLAAKLEELASSPERRAAMGRAGRKRYEKFFSSGGMLDRTSAVYEEVLAAGSPFDTD